MSKILAKFTNEEDGVESYVAAIESGFSVVLKDLDSGEFVSAVIIFTDEAAAIAKAQAII